MNLRGFSFADFERLISAALTADYQFLTLAEYLRADEPRTPFAIMRHDVDRKLDTARSMAHLEADLGITSTYYFRPSTFEPGVVAEIADLGHEVGYHYEAYAATGGDLAAAIERFEDTLARFREMVSVETVCSHGSPLSPYDNRTLWRRPDSPSLEEYDLLGEAYLSTSFDNAKPDELSYVSDTGRQWRTTLFDYGRIDTTDDLVAALKNRASPHLYVLVHPERWARNGLETLQRSAWDGVCQAGKFVAGTVHDTSAAVRIREGVDKIR